MGTPDISWSKKIIDVVHEIKLVAGTGFEPATFGL
jgi:hypothetical protein